MMNHPLSGTLKIGLVLMQSWCKGKVEHDSHFQNSWSPWLWLGHEKWHGNESAWESGIHNIRVVVQYRYGLSVVLRGHGWCVLNGPLSSIIDAASQSVREGPRSMHIHCPSTLHNISSSFSSSLSVWKFSFNKLISILVFHYLVWGFSMHNTCTMIWIKLPSSRQFQFCPIVWSLGSKADLWAMYHRKGKLNVLDHNSFFFVS